MEEFELFRAAGLEPKVAGLQLVAVDEVRRLLLTADATGCRSEVSVL